MTDTRIPLEAVLNAVRVPLLPRVPTVEIRYDRPSRWWIVDARIYIGSQTICLKYLSLHANKYSLLRRINLSLCPGSEELPEVVQCLTAFKHLTYFTLDLKTGAPSRIRWSHLSSPNENTTTPTCAVTLPNVRVLEYLSDSHVPTPSTLPPSDDPSPAFILNHPQMERFYFYGGLSGRILVVEWLTPFALRGLKSLIVGVGGALDIVWSELPNLEELACMNLEPKLLGRSPICIPYSEFGSLDLGAWSVEISLSQSARLH